MSRGDEVLSFTQLDRPPRVALPEFYLDGHAFVVDFSLGAIAHACDPTNCHADVILHVSERKTERVERRLR